MRRDRALCGPRRLCNVYEEPGDEVGSFRYGLGCTDATQPRLALDTHAGTAVRSPSPYGGDGLGFTSCEIEHRWPMRAHEVKGIAEEGDPKLEMDPGKSEVIVSNDDPGADRPREDRRTAVTPARVFSMLAG